MDPFEVEDGWFQLELVGFQIVPNPKVSAEIQVAIVDTVERLGLNDFCNDRAEDAELYWDGEISLDVLRRESPFVASELIRQGRLNATDNEAV